MRIEACENNFFNNFGEEGKVRDGAVVAKVIGIKGGLF